MNPKNLIFLNGSAISTGSINPKTGVFTVKFTDPDDNTATLTGGGIVSPDASGIHQGLGLNRPSSGKGRLELYSVNEHPASIRPKVLRSCVTRPRIPSPRRLDFGREMFAVGQRMSHVLWQSVTHGSGNADARHIPRHLPRIHPKAALLE